MRSVIVAITAALFAAPVAWAGPAEDAHATVERWVEAFNAGKAEDVAALYAADATIWGTVSPALATTPEAIRSYFTGALKAGLKVRMIDHSAQSLAGAVVSDVGRYNFQRPGDGGMVDLPARFTFVLVRYGDRWAIAHQHSSPMPKP